MDNGYYAGEKIIGYKSNEGQLGKCETLAAIPQSILFFVAVFADFHYFWRMIYNFTILNNRNKELAREPNSVLRKCVDITGKTEVCQMLQKIFIKVKLLNILNDLLKSGADGVSVFARIRAVKGIKHSQIV